MSMSRRKQSTSDADGSTCRLTLLPGGLVDLDDPTVDGRLADQLAVKNFTRAQGFSKDAAAIQRRKENEVLDQLPEVERPWVRAKLRRAWLNPDVDRAIRDLRALAGRLNHTTPEAAIALVDGLEEMFVAMATAERATMARRDASQMSATDRSTSEPTARAPGVVDRRDQPLAGVPSSLPNKINPNPAIRMLEGLEKMYNVSLLGVGGLLLKTVMGPSPLELMIDVVRAISHCQTGTVGRLAVTR